MQIIKDGEFGRRYRVRTLLKLLPFVASFALVWRGWGTLGGSFWIGIACFVAGVALWMRQDRALLRDYHCPKCGQRLPDPTVEILQEGDPIIFHCPTCEVGWDTGLRK